MPKWTEYTSKDTLADNDEVMLYDATAKANKRGLMSKFWDYVVDKMATAVISKLETDNKTIIGAINALNVNKLIRIRSKYTTNENGLIPVHGMLTNMNIDNIVAVKAYSPSDTKNIYTELYSYGSYAYALITDNNGNSITNTELNIVVFYMK